MANILVVDDERDVVALIKFLLEKDGHSVATAFNGKEALAQLGVDPPGSGPAARPDLMILDVMMPEIDGFTAAKRIAAVESLQFLPIIVLTAKGQMRELFGSVKNVKSFLDKPFDPKRLRELVKGLLAG